MPVKHPLSAKLTEALEKRARLAAADELPELRQRITSTLENLYSMSDDLVGPNFDLAEGLANCSLMLLNQYEKLSDEKKMLVIGTIEYFLANIDQVPDHTPMVGFDDDARVMNHALELLGRSDLYLVFD